ncbi:MAG: hypothetical protein ABGX03_05735 [Methylophilaceae bacterium]
MSLDPTTEQLVSSKPGVLSLAIKGKVGLFAACMHYVKGGSWFIPTNNAFNIGDEVRKKNRNCTRQRTQVYLPY